MSFTGDVLILRHGNDAVLCERRLVSGSHAVST